MGQVLPFKAQPAGKLWSPAVVAEAGVLSASAPHWSFHMKTAEYSENWEFWTSSSRFRWQKCEIPAGENARLGLSWLSQVPFSDPTLRLRLVKNLLESLPQSFGGLSNLKACAGLPRHML